MTRTPVLSSVNCTSCGAGLSVLGGGRVRSHVCGYCGAVLDSQDAYKVLDTIGKRDHPDSPATIGATVTVRDVPFTVIGTLGMREVWAGGRAEWVEHQLFSSTHGYAWLAWEGGNFTFTRKIRSFDPRRWMTSGEVENAEAPPTRIHEGRKFKYFETSTPEIVFMEGEFNWVPRLGKKPTGIVLLGSDSALTLRQGETEKEVEETWLLPREPVLMELGVDGDSLPPAKPHKLAPYRPMREETTLRKAFGLAAVAGVAMAIVFWSMPGQQVLSTARVTIDELPREVTFEITNTDQLAVLRLDTSFDNRWGVFGIELFGPDGAPLVVTERLIQYYSGGTGEDRWTEGSRSTSLRFHPELAGPHRLLLSHLEGNSMGLNRVSATVHEGKPTGLWMWVVAAVFGLGYIAVAARRALHEKRRFSGTDWYED